MDNRFGLLERFRILFGRAMIYICQEGLFV